VCCILTGRNNYSKNTVYLYSIIAAKVLGAPGTGREGSSSAKYPRQSQKQGSVDMHGRLAAAGSHAGT